MCGFQIMELLLRAQPSQYNRQTPTSKPGVQGQRREQAVNRTRRLIQTSSWLPHWQRCVIVSESTEILSTARLAPLLQLLPTHCK